MMPPRAFRSASNPLPSHTIKVSQAEPAQTTKSVMTNMNNASMYSPEYLHPYNGGYKPRVFAIKGTLASASEERREALLFIFAKALSTNDAPLDLIEEKILEASRAFNVFIRIIRAGNVITCTIGRDKAVTMDLKAMVSYKPDYKGLDFALRTYVAVAKGEITVKQAMVNFHIVQYQKSMQGFRTHVILAMVLAGIVSGFSSEATPIVVTTTMLTTVALCLLQYFASIRSNTLAGLIEGVIGIVVSVIIHNTYPGASIAVAMLPGYMFLCNVMKQVHEKNHIDPTPLWTALAAVYALSPNHDQSILLHLFWLYSIYQVIIKGGNILGRVHIEWHPRSKRSNSTVQCRVNVHKIVS